MKEGKFIVSVFFLSYVLCFPVVAQTYLFVGAEFPHVLEEDSEGHIQGVGADIATEIVEAMGHSIEIKLYPWERAQRMLKNGEADAIIGPYKTAERLTFMDYSSDHFYVDRLVLYVKKNSDITWDGDFSVLKEHVIGATLGWSYGTAFNRIKSALHLSVVKDLCTNFKKLMIGRVDIVPATYRNALICIETLNLPDKIALLTPDIQTINGYYGFSKQKDLSDFKMLFNQRLHQMIDNGTVSLINNKYQLQY